MEVVAGSYEEIVFGYKIVDLESEPKFESVFSDHSHRACVRAVAINQRGILATGGSDEVINLLNLKRNVELGTLMHHRGTITSLAFYKKSHMFSASEDGTIGVWHVGKWECLRTLKGHKGAVTSMSVHPSGKLALSVGRDKTLRTWNLITGKSAYIVNIKQVADDVVWSPCGNYYLALFDNVADIYSVQTGTVHCTLRPGFRVNVVRFIQDDVVAFGGEDGKVAFHSIQTPSDLYSFSTQTTRVRGLCSCPCEGSTTSFWLVSASSDGKIQLWKIHTDPWSHTLLCDTDTKFRLTCLTMYTPETAPEAAEAKTEVKEEVKEESSDELEVKSEPTAVVSKRKRNRKRKQKAATSPAPQDTASPTKRKKQKNAGKNAG